MPYSPEARRYAAEILTARRHASREADERRRAELTARVTRLGELEGEIARVGSDAAMAALGSNRERTSELTAQLLALSGQRDQLLRDCGADPASLEASHHCHLCSDTGLMPDGSTCQCAASLMRSFAVSEINSRSPLSLSRFDDFSLDYYPAENDPELGCSPRQMMARVFKRCREYADGFSGRSGSLLMIGDTGLGKTHLALSIAGAALERGFDAVYCSAASALRAVESEYFDSGHSTATLDALKGCGLLVLDDLGSEYVNNFICSAIYDLVNTRVCAGRPSIYTSNFTAESALAVRYGEKVSSRLTGCCELLYFAGDDIRKLKK